MVARGGDEPVPVVHLDGAAGCLLVDRSGERFHRFGKHPADEQVDARAGGGGCGVGISLLEELPDRRRELPISDDIVEVDEDDVVVPG